MRMEQSFGDGLTIWKFFQGEKKVGQMKVSFHLSHANIFSIESYENGCGTKMVEHLKKIKKVKTIDGDVSEGTERFWLSVGATIEDETLFIKC